jgi:hypothetical protein
VGGANRPGFLPAENEKSYSLPDDLSRDFPDEVYQWIKPTQLTIAELIKHDYYFSKRFNRLYRLLENGCAESRRLGSDDTGPKARFFGEKSSVTGIIRFHGGCSGVGRGSICNDNIRSHHQTDENPCIQQEGEPTTHVGNAINTLCMVEDSLSAIKVSRAIDAAPLFGSSINNDKLNKLVKEYQLIYVWLDSDKYEQAQLIAGRIKMLGKLSRVIYTKLDPKYCNIIF